MLMLIKNAHVISPGVELKNAAIEMENNFIKHVYKEGESLPSGEKEFDAGEKMVVPGFIDVHIHAGMGYEATTDDPKAVPAIAGEKLREGVTSFCPTTLTLSKEQLAVSLKHIEKYRLHPTASRVIGTHLEGPFINPKCAGAQNPTYLRAPNFEEIQALNDISRVSIVSYAPELEGSVEFTKDLRDAGICSSCGHTNATMAQFMACKKAGLHRLTHFCNQMTKLHHREIGMVGTGLYDDDVYIEMICDKIHLCPDMIKLIFKLKPIDKILLITDAMEATGLPDGNYQLGGLDVVVADGAARLASNGALAGSILQYNTALKNVYELTGLPLKELIKTTSLNQAQNLGLSKLGKVEDGFRADITVLDQKFNVHAVFMDGVQKI